MNFLLTIVKSILSPIFCKIILISITSSVIGICVLLLKKFIGKKISLRVNYYLWIIFLISLVLLPKIQSDLSIYNFINIEKINEISINFSFDSLDTYENINHEEKSVIKDFKTRVENQIKKLEPQEIFAIIYFLIIIIKIIRRIRIYFGLVLYEHEKLKDNSEEMVLVQNIKNKLRIKRKIKIYKTPYISSPMIGGFIFPKIWISTSNNLNDLYYMLAHEFCHYKRRDYIVNLFLNVFRIIYFFNPFIIRVLNRIEKDIELATDELALKTLNSPKSKKYCNLIIFETAKKSNIKINLGFGKIDFTEERINAILNDNNISTKKKYYIFILFFYIVIIIFCFTNKKISINQEDINYIYIVVNDVSYKKDNNNVEYPIIKCKENGIIRVKGNENIYSLKLNTVDINNETQNSSLFFFNNDDIIIDSGANCEKILYKMRIKYNDKNEKEYCFILDYD